MFFVTVIRHTEIVASSRIWFAFSEFTNSPPDLKFEIPSVEPPALDGTWWGLQGCPRWFVVFPSVHRRSSRPCIYMLVASVRDERYSGYLMFRNATEEECIVISRILAMVLSWSSCFFCLLQYFLPFKWTARTLTPSDKHIYSPTSKHTQSVVLPSACTCDSLHCSNSALPSWSKLHHVLSIMINDSTKISIRHHRDIYVY